MKYIMGLFITMLALSTIGCGVKRDLRLPSSSSDESTPSKKTSTLN